MKRIIKLGKRKKAYEDEEEIDVGWYVNVDVDEEGWDDMVDGGFLTPEDINDGVAIVEKNFKDYLSDKFETVIQDEGHDSTGALLGTMWLNEDLIIDIVEGWESVGDEFILNSQSGSIWGEFDEYRAFKGISDDFARIIDVSVGVFDIPEKYL